MAARVKSVTFLGTGTSSQVPAISCLIASPQTCAVCQDAVRPGSKNRRRNTSLLIRFSHPDGRDRFVVIDAGKSFYEAAVAFFPENGVERLDGVILTHDHADAVLGLDDLRSFTLTGTVQDAVDVYLSTRTMNWIAAMFPYMVDTGKATGGGDVPKLRFHVFEEHLPSFEIEQLMFTPIPVWHGEPYMCLGFRFDDITYLSDISAFPEPSIELVRNTKILIIDGLHPDKTHKSHFSILQALQWIKTFEPQRAFVVGFAHMADHHVLEKQFKELEGPTQVEPAYDGQLVIVAQ